MYPQRTFIWLLVKFCATVRVLIQLIPLDRSKIRSTNWGIVLIYVALSIEAFPVLLGFLLREKTPNIPQRIMGWIRCNVYLGMQDRGVMP